MRRQVALIAFLVPLAGAALADTPAYRPSPDTPPVLQVRNAYEAGACAPFDRMIAMAQGGSEAAGKPKFGTVHAATELQPLFQNHVCKAWSNSAGGYTVNCKMTSPNWQWPGQFKAYRGGTLKMCYPGWTRTDIADTSEFASPDGKTRWSLSIPDQKYYGYMVETSVRYEPKPAQ